MLRLTLLGADSLLCSELCANCPEGPAGCCVAPPEVDFSDVGRIVGHGGLDFLLSQIALKNLLPTETGLRVRRVKRREASTEPLERKCVFHGKGGCTIRHEFRPATCNYFLCEHAFQKGEGGDSMLARRAHGALRAFYERVDAELLEEARKSFPDGIAWNAAFLEWLGERFAERNSAKIP